MTARVDTLLLSDLHLPAAPSPLRQRLRALLAGSARSASAVYILGDLFEYWIGDDVGVEVYAEEIAALKALTAAGVPVLLQHGNRDFLLGQTFTHATGTRLLPDPAVVTLGTRSTLLSHGDRWCIDDVGYQRFRRFARNPLAQAVFLRLPVSLRERVAGGLRTESGQQKQRKASAIMDVNTECVAAAFDAHSVTRIIHGHTHRPMTHAVQLAAGAGERIVLPDWRPGDCRVLWVTADGTARFAEADR
ncbi:UDP-2,3-diacylglucosamine diphosphatase [Flagellatimonas centrodinii]|uniref:UDP-2,3-diacylglucosamine diphosphatase n=1 Tax=Flagellatimonas centrodinii TaxID=2806210 RepID=UPI001FEE9900|nr:UDP-2,3-diacylglucosamine diphosphatase [Flagellatimonas centrodinii]ULQ46430.1 UDP-2,3-diacylglucosamine diphosphatase [Flagellatimonas centrodinii]